MRFGIKIIWVWAIVALFCEKVTGQHFPEKERFKVSLNMGFNTSTIIGDELQNGTLKPGLLIGVDYRQKLGKSPFQVRTTLQAAYRGSRFSHTSSDHYYKLNLAFAELPVDLLFKVGNTNTFISIGGSANALLQSEFFIRPDFTAEDAFNNIGFTRFDYSGRVGVLFDLYYFAWSIDFQLGLRDINNNLFLENVLPETGNGGSIRTLGINTKIHF
jgi:hypothetical protein